MSTVPGKQEVHFVDGCRVDSFRCEKESDSLFFYAAIRALISGTST